MKINACFDDIASHKTDALIVGTFSDFDTEEKKTIDSLLGNAVKTEMDRKRFRADFKEMLLINTLGKMKSDMVIMVGLGKKGEFTTEKLRKASGISAKMARDKGALKVSIALGSIKTEGDSAYAAAEGALLGLYKFSKFKTQNLDKIKRVDEIVVLGDRKYPDKINESVKKASLVCGCVSDARDLVNMPSAIKTPTYIAEQARKVASECKLKITVLGKAELKKAGCNAIMAVGQGSSNKPKLVILEYAPKGAKETIALVGKGVTFDSGGLNIKTGDSMETMKEDMAGAAVVLNVIRAASKLGIKKRIICVMPLAENMPGPDAQKPGDIITAYNGKTIEMLNSDAEGRLILADALSYVEKNYKLDMMIDLATLTGGCIYAIGTHASAIMGNNPALIDGIRKSGNETYERVWEFPMWEEYKENIKSDNADVSNNSKKGVGANTINGAMFLENFVENTHWAHLDMASISYINENRDYVPKNATGWGVRLLVNWLEK